MTFCSRMSLERREGAAGTAVRGEAYVLLPVDKRFWKESELNTSWAGRAELQAIRAARRSAIVVRLYDPPDARDAAHPIFVHLAPGRTRPPGLDELLAEFSARGPVATPGPQLAVCTHGTRDRCCAKYGFSAWREALRLHADGRSAFEPLQTSHLGGDRFAATGVVFPSGSMYANLDGPHLPDLLAAEAAGRIAPDHYRGGVFEPQLVQIVRAGLARQGLFNDLDVRLQVARTEGDPDTAVVQAGAERFQVTLGHADVDFYGSCEDVAAGRASKARRTIFLRAGALS
ncbi:MAG: sucrase ferredoxin [Phenylobacterium sp.]